MFCAAERVSSDSVGAGELVEPLTDTWTTVGESDPTMTVTCCRG